jgi:hypothetical protein
VPPKSSFLDRNSCFIHMSAKQMKYAANRTLDACTPLSRMLFIGYSSPGVTLLDLNILACAV